MAPRAGTGDKPIDRAKQLELIRKGSCWATGRPNYYKPDYEQDNGVAWQPPADGCTVEELLEHMSQYVPNGTELGTNKGRAEVTVQY